MTAQPKVRRVAAEDADDLLLVSNIRPNGHPYAVWFKKGPDAGALAPAWAKLKQEAIEAGITKDQTGFTMVVAPEIDHPDFIDVIFKAVMNKHPEAFQNFLLAQATAEKDRDGDQEMGGVPENQEMTELEKLEAKMGKMEMETDEQPSITSTIRRYEPEVRCSAVM